VPRDVGARPVLWSHSKWLLWALVGVVAGGDVLWHASDWTGAWIIFAAAFGVFPLAALFRRRSRSARVHRWAGRGVWLAHAAVGMVLALGIPDRSRPASDRPGLAFPTPDGFGASLERDACQPRAKRLADRHPRDRAARGVRAGMRSVNRSGAVAQWRNGAAVLGRATALTGLVKRRQERAHPVLGKNATAETLDARIVDPGGAAEIQATFGDRRTVLRSPRAVQISASVMGWAGCAGLLPLIGANAGASQLLALPAGFATQFAADYVWCRLRGPRPVHRPPRR
jgi:hypothetical protein